MSFVVPREPSSFRTRLSFWQRSDATLTVAKRALCSSCRPLLSHTSTTCLKDPLAHPIRQVGSELPPTPFTTNVQAWCAGQLEGPGNTFRDVGIALKLIAENDAFSASAGPHPEWVFLIVEVADGVVSKLWREPWAGGHRMRDTGAGEHSCQPRLKRSNRGSHSSRSSAHAICNIY